MTEYRNEEDALRRALDDAASHVPVSDAPVPVALTETRDRHGRRTGAVLVAAAVALSLVVATLVVSFTRDDHGREVSIKRDATSTVIAALAATVGSGGYDLDFTFHTEVGTQGSTNGCTTVQHATSGGSDASSASGSSSQGGAVVCMSTHTTDVSGHGTVNTEPYAMTVVSQVSGLGQITLFVDGSNVWELGGADYGTGGAVEGAPPGASLAGFAGLVEGTLGQEQGALSMMSLANNSGYLGLEATAIEKAVPDGEGALADGTHLTYYDVTIDVTKMADGEGLTDEQRQAVTDAVAVLHSVGYSGTDERLGIDDAGFIREVSATTNFASGASMTRHTFFSNFGCAAKIAMPNQPAVQATAGACPPVPASTTTTAPVTMAAPTSTPTTTSTTAPATTAAPTSTTAAPTSEPPSTTGAPASTTIVGGP
jgi:hypothetical protein